MIEGTKYDIVIQNVVAVGSLDQKMDLMAIMKIFRNVKYRPKRFPGLVFRLKQPKTATLIFSTGKMVCTGAKSEKMAKSAVRKVVRELRKAGFIIRGSPKIEIVNVVGTADVGGDVDIEAVSDILDNTMYEPEQFPGLIYRMKEPKVVILMFRSGKLVLTGGKSKEQVNEAVDKIVSILTENKLIY
ncbi:Ribonuclease HIII [subsurface metagenome]